MSQAGFAEVDLVVNGPRQDDQAIGLDHFVSGGSNVRINGCDLAIAQQKIGFGDAAREDDASAANQGCRAHESAQSLWGVGQPLRFFYVVQCRLNEWYPFSMAIRNEQDVVQ